MPNRPPPSGYTGSPKRISLPTGSRLTRIHDARFPALSFNPTLADAHWGGGRFDATGEDPYGYLYAGGDDLCAVAESLLRDLPLDASGSQLLPRRSLTGRKISWLAPTRGLALVSLRSGRDLAAVGQDSWLTKCESREYGFTRRWAHQLRGWAPWAQGLVWRSRREEESLAYVFFEDRCPAGSFVEIHEPTFPAPDGNRLDREPGLSYVRKLLAEYNVTVFRDSSPPLPL